MSKSIINFKSDLLRNVSNQYGTEAYMFMNQLDYRQHNYVARKIERTYHVKFTGKYQPLIRRTRFPKNRYSKEFWSMLSKMPYAIIYRNRLYWLDNKYTSRHDVEVMCVGLVVCGALPLSKLPELQQSALNQEHAINHRNYTVVTGQHVIKQIFNKQVNQKFNLV